MVRDTIVTENRRGRCVIGFGDPDEISTKSASLYAQMLAHKPRLLVHSRRTMALTLT